MNKLSNAELKRLQRALQIYYCYACGDQIDATHNPRLDSYYCEKADRDIMCIDCMQKLKDMNFSTKKPADTFTEQEKLDMYARLRIGAIQMHMNNYLVSLGLNSLEACAITEYFVVGTITNDIDIKPFIDSLMEAMERRMQHDK